MTKKTNPATLSHLDSKGQLQMVDVSAKASTARTARAQGLLKCTPATADALLSGNLKKGEALAVARLAGVMAAKQTGNLIPLCHPLPLDGVQVEFEKVEHGILILGEAKCTGRTGVEMEALMAVSIAGLTLYDMGKSVEKEMVLTDVYLETKTGGKSGTWTRKGASS